jgi:hypothetical protein
MSKSISKQYLLTLRAPDPSTAARLGMACPKFSERLKVYEKKGIPHARQLAEREHLINLRSRYPQYSQQIGVILRSESNTKNKGGFAAPYTLD